MGGACAALISVIEYNHMVHTSGGDMSRASWVPKGLIILAGLVIGSISFRLYFIAYKLEGKINDFSIMGQTRPTSV